MRIHKYSLEVTDQQDVEMPRGAQILSVQFQYDTLQIWALVDEEEVITRVHRIGIFGTGNPLPNHMILGKFIGTVQMAGGRLVFHIFELNF